MTWPLDRLLVAERLARLVQMVFPDDAGQLDAPLVWADDADVVTAVEQFLSRVDAQRFPVYAELWDCDVDEALWRLDEIPILPAGLDLDEAGHDLDEPVPYLLAVCYDPDSLPDGYPNTPLPPGLDPVRLVDRLRRLPPAAPELDGLADLLAMVLKTTGNPWLDWSARELADSGGGPPWEAETVAWLATTWDDAQPALDRALTLLAWPTVTAAAKAVAVHARLLAACEVKEADDAAANATPGDA